MPLGHISFRRPRSPRSASPRATRSRPKTACRRGRPTLAHLGDVEGEGGGEEEEAMWTTLERGLNSRGQAMWRAGQPLQCDTTAEVGSSGTRVRIEVAAAERSRRSAPPSLPPLKSRHQWWPPRALGRHEYVVVSGACIGKKHGRGGWLGVGGSGRSEAGLRVVQTPANLRHFCLWIVGEIASGPLRRPIQVGVGWLPRSGRLREVYRSALELEMPLHTFIFPMLCASGMYNPSVQKYLSEKWMYLDVFLFYFYSFLQRVFLDGGSIYQLPKWNFWYQKIICNCERINVDLLFWKEAKALLFC